ncbi:MAG: riboflavin synthase [Pseudomonadota bacterium]
MFTGIVREVGRVLEIETRGDTRIRLACARPLETIEIGASISCSGVCLTVTETGTSLGQTWFAIDASAETLSKTTLGTWTTGTKVNLEPALRVGDELGGHIVAGHVDGVGTIRSISPEGSSHRVVIEAPAMLGPFLAPKGSITLDGISLTVNEVEDAATNTCFGVNIIPHTWQETNLSDATEGSSVNLEIDVLARYVARLAEVTAKR